MKQEILISKPETNAKSAKRYDLEDRTHQFARDIREFVSRIPSSIANREDAKQMVRSSGSVGANYLEANESLSKKDFIMRIKISKKEARETIYWLELISFPPSLDSEHRRLMQEATEIMKILGAILRNSQ